MKQYLMPNIYQMKISLPMHQYIDLTQQIQDSSQTLEQSNYQEKDIQEMVEKLNNWQAKKLEREQLIAQENNQQNKPFSAHFYN